MTARSRPAACAFLAALLSCPALALGAEAAPAPLDGYREGGLTSRQVAERAVRTSFDARARAEQLRAAAAKVDEALVGLFPRLSGVARYTRLSNFTPPSLTGSSESLLATAAAPGTANPATFAVAPPIVPNVLDNYLLQATLIVPLSDYPARLLPLHEAASDGELAARHDLAAARARAWAEGQIAFYSWLRARGAETLAAQAVAACEAHVHDAQGQLSAGNVSRADERRAVTALDAAKLALSRAHQLALLEEDEVRLAMHAPAGEPLAPGERLDDALPPVNTSASMLYARATSERSELRSLRAQASAEDHAATAARSLAWPALSAFADAIDANPNPRRFPPSSTWLATWDVGVQLTISPNDIGIGASRGAQERAKASALAAETRAAEDAVTREVDEALRAVATADDAITTSADELENALEAYRTARALFAEGRFASATLSDAETDLTRARFDVLNARVDARVGRVRLAHALGEDVSPSTL